MSLATSTIKCILLVFNFIFAFSSLGICFLGFVISSKAASFKDATGGQITVLASLLVLTGALVFFAAFFGCCGVVRESRCMILSYSSILLFLFLVEACLGVAALLNESSIRSSSKQTLDTILRDVYDSKDNREFLDRIQTDLRCCGVDGPQDWKGQIPLSCCNLESSERSYCSLEEIYTQGCLVILVDQAQSLATSLGVVAIGVALMKIIGMVFALCLVNSIRNDKRRGFA